MVFREISIKILKPLWLSCSRSQPRHNWSMQSFTQCFITISASQLTLLDFMKFFYNHCNIMSSTYKGVRGGVGWVVGRAGSWRWVKPSVRTVWTSCNSKNCQSQAQTHSEGLKDVSLPLGWISDPCLPCSTLHGSYSLSCEFIWSEKPTPVSQAW